MATFQICMVNSQIGMASFQINRLPLKFLPCVSALNTYFIIYILYQARNIELEYPAWTLVVATMLAIASLVPIFFGALSYVIRSVVKMTD